MTAALSAEAVRAAVARAAAAPLPAPQHIVHPADLDIWNHWYATGEWDETRARVFNPDTRTWERRP